ncbi:DUF72 domain-containing protein [Vibrio sp.]|nr:DUF72 domain-containing protein [Vibrio sp.]
MWSHDQWKGTFFEKGTSAAQRLEQYANVFNTVEGNTTFYASPTPSTVRNWKEATHPDFAFNFKFPKSITHQFHLKHCQEEVTSFLQLMAPLHERINQWMIQLPASFTPKDLPVLQRFVQQLPSEISIGVEVRHLSFFQKGAEEKALNRWLHENNYNRIIMDTRPLFSEDPHSSAIIDAQKKKPKVPCHAISTGQYPMLRFIGQSNPEKNRIFFKPWVKKLTDWMSEGKTPLIMIHTPDNIYAPELAQQLFQDLNTYSTSQGIPLADLPHFPAKRDHDQLSMFD